MSAIHSLGCKSPCTRPSIRRSAAVELVAIVLLALSTLVAVTAVSIEMARADLLDNISNR